MREVLRDAETTPSADGWQRLERELEVVPRRRALRLDKPRIAAAAAAVLILAAGGTFLLRGKHEVVKDGYVIVAEATEGSDAAAFSYTAPTGAGSAGAGGDSAPASVSGNVGFSAVSVGRNDASETAHAERTGETFPATCGVPVSGNGSGEAAADSREGGLRGRALLADAAPRKERARHSSHASDAVQALGDVRSPRTQLPDDDFRPAEKPRRQVSFGINTSGTLTGGSESGSGMPLLTELSGSGAVVALRSSRYHEARFRHRQSLSFGFSVRKEFPYGLSLESGVLYSLLRSDVQMPNGTSDVSQKLHFIGVPLRLNWRFLEKGGFSLYIGAGGMVEKCVSAKFGSYSVDEPGVQCSLLAAAGAQYAFNDRWGLYFEPEAAWYLNDTRLKTVRTDAPLTLTLRLGLRLSF